MKRFLVMEWTDAIFDMDGLRMMFLPLSLVVVLNSAIAGIIMGTALVHHSLLMVFANGHGPLAHIACGGGTFIGVFILAVIVEIKLADRAYRRGRRRSQ